MSGNSGSFAEKTGRGFDKDELEIVTRQTLNENDLAAIRGLEGLCNQHDGIRLKLNWDIITDRKPGSNDDFLCFDKNGALAGYLAVYCFGRSEAEISGMVDPSYRRKRICSVLLEHAIEELKARNVRSILFINDRGSASGTEFIKASGAVYDHSEHLMELPGDMEPVKVTGPVELRRAVQDDIELIAGMDSICFNTPVEESRAFYNEAWLDCQEHKGAAAKTQMFIVATEGKDIGMIRLNTEKDDIFIYGFGIKPEYRGFGHGRAALGLAVNKALSSRPLHVALEVDCVNDTALSLYKSCGFTTKCTYDYYRVSID